MTMRTVGYAYPWDVLDVGFLERTREVGVDEVAVALSYHAARAATPWSAMRTAVDARTSALYRPRRPGAFSDLVPGEPHWAAEEADSGGAAVLALERAGVPAVGWIVLAHDDDAASRPDVCVVNCFGERYPWALCPSRPAVRRYSAELAAEAVRDLPLTGFVLESCGQMGVVHQCRHEKTEGAWTLEVQRLLSVCCCAACASAWTGSAEAVVGELRAAVARAARGATGPLLDPALAAELLAVRHAATDALRREVLEVLPGGRVTLHASADPFATSALPGLTGTAGDDVDCVVLSAWTPGADALAAVRTVRAALPARTSVGAYVTTVAAAPQPRIADDVVDLVGAGIDELHLYHLGLAGAHRRPQLLAASAAARGVPAAAPSAHGSTRAADHAPHPDRPEEGP